MADEKLKFTSVDDYIEASVADIDERLVQMRRVIQAALPSAEETISYNIPAYRQNGVIVIQFAGYTAHTSLVFYPTTGVYAHFEAELATYKTSKSAVTLPLSEPLPLDLIDAIARFRLTESAEHVARRKAGK